MTQRSHANVRTSAHRFASFVVASLLLLLVAPFHPAASQEPAAQGGSIGGTVTDERGRPVVGAEVLIEGTTIGTLTGADGEYVITQVPVGQQPVRVRMIGFRSEAADVTVVAGDRVTRDFTLAGDPLELQEIVVTGTQTPRVNRESSVAITTLTTAEVQQSVPRSTTEMLRYVPGSPASKAPVAKSTRTSVCAGFSVSST